MAAAPTVVWKSVAICGSSESVTRTCAWLAKPATASRMIDRVGVLCGVMGGDEGASTSDFAVMGGVSRPGRR